MNFKLILIGLLLVLFSTQVYADTTPPTTTFSSNQVPNTTDQNITLTCTDNNTGCKTINYNINNEGWNAITTNTSLTDDLVAYYKFDETSGTTLADETGTYPITHSGTTLNQAGKIGKAITINATINNFNIGYLGTNSSISFWHKLISGTNGPGAMFEIPVTSNKYHQLLIDYNGTNYNFTSYSQCSGTNYSFNSSSISSSNYNMITVTWDSANYYVYINGVYEGSFTKGSNGSCNALNWRMGRYNNQYFDEIGIWDRTLTSDEITILYNSGAGLTYPFGRNNYSFLYSGAGDHNIQYFSTDNSDNNESIKTSYFTTYGNGRFYFKDENSGSDLTGVQVNFNGTDYDSGANNYIDFNFQTLSSTNTTYLFTLTKTGYSTRYYQTDLNYFGDFNITFALLPDSLDTDVPFKVYETDETTIYSNTFVEVKDKDTNYTVGRLKTNSSGEVTFNIRLDDSNYWTIVDDGAYTYSPVTLTILYPKDEETLAQITERWKIEISQNLYAYYSDLNASKVIYLLPNTALPYNIKIGDMNGNYFQRTYSKIYPGNPLTDTIQPYLVKTATGLLTTVTTKNAITNTNISGITIKIYKFIPGQGRTLVEQVTTDNKGQAMSLLVLGSEYEFECYSGATFIKTYTITATSSTIFIYLQPTTDTPETTPSGFAVKYTPTYSGLNKLNVGTQVFTQTAFNNYGVSVSYVSQIIQGGILSSQSYTGSDANKTFSHTINWIDINNDVPVVSRLTITYGGKNYVYQTNYIVNDSFGTNYNLLEGLSTGLRSDAGCEATGICFPLMTIALLLSIGLTIWVAISMGQLGQQTAGIVLLLAMVVFTYLSWIPFELTVACVLILLAFVVNERRN